MTTPKDRPDGFLPPHGGYEQLASYRKSLVVFRATRYFCRRFISKRDRTYDQMIQAARSGKQNIVEGRTVRVAPVTGRSVVSSQ